jgi:hypothetical protein
VWRRSSSESSKRAEVLFTFFSSKELYTFENEKRRKSTYAVEREECTTHTTYSQ